MKPVSTTIAPRIPRSKQRIQTNQNTSMYPNLSLGPRLAGLLTFLFIAFALFLPSRQAEAKSGDIRISLTAQPAGLGGKATVKHRLRGGEQELQVEVEVARRFAGVSLTVVVGSTVIGDLTIDAFGKGRLSLNSRRDQAIPTIGAGTTVAILNSNGMTAFFGSF